MRRHVFFKRDEIKKAKDERRNPVAVFSIECDLSTLLKIVQKNDLEMDWIFS